MSRSSSAFLSMFVLLISGCLGGSGPVDPGDAGPRCATDEDCDDEIFCNGRELCAPDEEGALANGCLVGTPPCGEQPCLEEMDSCELECPDGDGDGQEDAACGGTDCDDSDANVFLGAPEVCDAAGIDEDCDPTTVGIDADGDGFPSTRCCNGPPGAQRCGEDCDDARASANPDAPEVCNGLDDDCDGSLDEGVTITFYRDADGDSYGDVTVTMEACSPPTGWTILSGDCNDANPNISPGRPESCLVRGADDDCDGNIDEICDCSPADPPITCGPGAPEAGRGVCRDGTQVCSSAGTYGDCMGGVYPGEETCDGLDEDCDGRVDEGGGRACPQNASVSGTTACGRAGVRRCGADCQWLDAEYLAAGETAESCDYCADSSGGWSADKVLAAVTWLHAENACGLQSNCDSSRHERVGEASYPYMINDGSAASEAGAIWGNTVRVGYGSLVAREDVLAEVLGGRSAGHGWSVALVRSTSAVIGPAGRFGIPTGLMGVRAVWRHSGGSEQPARLSVIRESDGRVFWERSLPGSQHDFETALTAQNQSIAIRISPDDPSTERREFGMRVEFYATTNFFAGSTLIDAFDCGGFFGECPFEVEPGDEVRVVVGGGGTPAGTTGRVTHRRNLSGSSLRRELACP
jgi:hypothetical protein